MHTPRMVSFITTVIVTTEQNEERKKRGVGWRYLIGKGLQYVQEVEPMINEITLARDKTRRASSALQLLAWVREKYPQIFQEYQDDVNGVK